MKKGKGRFKIGRRNEGKRGGSRKPKDDSMADFIKKNRSKIEQMKISNNLLRDEIKTEKKIAERNNRLTESKILDLKKQGIKYAKKIEHESTQLNKMKILIDKYEEKIRIKKDILRDLEGNKSSAYHKQIKSKEHELEKKLQRYNEALANNKSLRNQINHLRKERSLYDKIYYNLEMDIMRKKEELMELIEEADKKQSEKMKQKDKLEEIQNYAEKIQTKFKEEYTILVKQEDKRVIGETEDSKNKEQMTKTFHTKDDRSLSMTATALRPKSRIKSMATTNNNLRVDFNIEKKEEKISEEMEEEDEFDEYQNLKNFFDLLYKETEMESVDDIIENFQNIDQINDELFQQIQVINEEVDQAQDEVNQKNQNIENLLKPLSTEEKNKLQKIEKLQEKIKENEEKIEVFDQKINGLTMNLDSFSTNLPTIMNILDMKTPDELKYNDKNLNILRDDLTEVEKRINSLVEIHTILQTYKSGNDQKIEIEEKSEKTHTKKDINIINDLTKKITVKGDILKKEEPITKDLRSFREKVKMEIQTMELGGNDPFKAIRNLTSFRSKRSYSRKKSEI